MTDRHIPADDLEACRGLAAFLAAAEAESLADFLLDLAALFAHVHDPATGRAFLDREAIDKAAALTRANLTIVEGGR